MASALEAQSQPEIFTARATQLIIAACTLGRRPVVLLPALFCTEVANAVEAAGLRYRCYDVPSDLSSAQTHIGNAMNEDVGAILVLHPFGLSRPTRVDAGPEVIVIEDACHALRTSLLDTSIGTCGSLSVFSFRKEFGWRSGGYARGSLVPQLMNRVRADCSVARRWNALDQSAVWLEGRNATRLAVERLGGVVPCVAGAEVLTAIPLKSRRRDFCIQRLRSAGVMAWRWIGRLKTTGTTSTPRALALKRELFLVPLPMSGSAERVLDLLANQPVHPWND